MRSVLILCGLWACSSKGKVTLDVEEVASSDTAVASELSDSGENKRDSHNR